MVVVVSDGNHGNSPVRCSETLLVKASMSESIALPHPGHMEAERWGQSVGGRMSVGGKTGGGSMSVGGRMSGGWR